MILPYIKDPTYMMLRWQRSVERLNPTENVCQSSEPKLLIPKPLKNRTERLCRFFSFNSRLIERLRLGLFSSFPRSFLTKK